MTLCVDEDPRTSDLIEVAARGRLLRARATLVEDEAGVREMTSKVEERYLPADVAARSWTSCCGSRAASAVEIDAGALARLGSGQGLAGALDA